MVAITLTDDPTVDRALGRSVLYSTLAVALRPPAADSLERLRGEAGSTVLLRAAGVVDASIVPAVTAVIRAAKLTAVEELGESYRLLFGHTARGKVVPYETEYGPEEIFRQSQELADINGFYNAFGLTLVSSKHERSDHISAECEFLSFLTCKEAHTLPAGDRDSRENVRRAEKLFLREHLGHFGRAFARSLTREAGHSFYRATGELCLDFLTGECRDLGVPPGPEFIQLRPTSEIDVPMACSSGCDLMRNGPPCTGGPDVS